MHALGMNMESNRSYEAVKCHLHSHCVFSDTAVISLISATL